MLLRPSYRAQEWLYDVKYIYSKNENNEVVSTDMFTPICLLMSFERIDMWFNVVRHFESPCMKWFIGHDANEVVCICQNLSISQEVDISSESDDDDNGHDFDLEQWANVLFDTLQIWARNDITVEQATLFFQNSVGEKNNHNSRTVSQLVSMFVLYKNWRTDKKRVKDMAEAAMVLLTQYNRSRYIKGALTWLPAWVREKHNVIGSIIAGSPTYSDMDLLLHPYFLAIALHYHRCETDKNVLGRRKFISRVTFASKDLRKTKTLVDYTTIFSDMVNVYSAVQTFFDYVKENYHVESVHRSGKHGRDTLKRSAKQQNHILVQCNKLYDFFCQWCTENKEEPNFPALMLLKTEYLDLKNFKCILYHYTLARFINEFSILLMRNSKGYFYGNFFLFTPKEEHHEEQQKQPANKKRKQT